MTNWLNVIQWNEQGLIPVIVQEQDSREVLMHAWMNREALLQTQKSGSATFWSRSRKQLWMKGETSGHTQQVQSIRLDCDNDTLLLTVRQIGGISCHTGRKHCFYQTLSDNHWQSIEPVAKDPADI